MSNIKSKSLIHSTLNKIAWCVLIYLKRISLKNKGFTLIANNCNGGIIYHSMGERFLSPTINLFIPVEDYFCFLENIHEAVATDIYEIETDRAGKTFKYPLGELTLKNGKTIQIHFMHYKSFDEAQTKWIERCKRINFRNLFVLMEMGIETTDEYAERFRNLPFKHKVAITNREFTNTDCTIFVDIYGESFKWGRMVSRIPGTLHRHIELFDYIHWINTAEIKHAKIYKKFIQQNS